MCEDIKGIDDDDNNDDEDDNDKDAKDDKCISALGLDRNLGFLKIYHISSSYL